MRVLTLSLTVLLGCASSRDAAPAGASAPAPAAAPAPTGTLTLRLGGPYPGFSFPLEVAYSGGSLTVTSGARQSALIPASSDELVAIDIRGWRRIWLPLSPNEEVLLSAHPCCGIERVPAHSSRGVCPSAPDGGACPAGSSTGDGQCQCPDGTEPVAQRLADDEQCGDVRRCVPIARFRVVSLGGASPLFLARPDGSSVPAAADTRGASYLPATRDAAGMMDAGIRRGAAPPSENDELRLESLAFEDGGLYTVYVSATGIDRVTRDRAQPATAP